MFVFLYLLVFFEFMKYKMCVCVCQSFQVHATDPDEGLNGTVIFELDSQDTGPFQINPFSKSTIYFKV